MALSAQTINYSIWTGLAGVALEYYKRRGSVGWKSLLMNGFGEKAVYNAMSVWLQSMNLPLLGSGLDANYLYQGVIGAVGAELRKTKGPLTGAEEQIFCSLIGHRLAAQWGGTFNGISGNISNMFANASGYSGATTAASTGGTGMPSQASGNP